MHITKIELEDIKSHIESTFEFQKGTTAITGTNGAGKTTLIEAIAWTLFDLLDYKKDDFVRRGAKKGIARVTFESSLDERRYVVYRDTKTRYYVYDPKLKMRIAEKKEEVTRFLWQHLGVEPGTDLESLFRRAIGVPQGTFTAIFLETPTERKKAFDKLLKVEEYRQGAEKLRETARYIDGKIINSREKIARAEGELSRMEPIEVELKKINEETKTLSKSLKTFENESEKKQKLVKDFEEIASKVNQLNTELNELNNEKSKLDVVLSQKESEKEKAEQSAQKIKGIERDYQAHLNALGRIKELERERIERDKFNVELAKIEAAIINVKAEEKATKETRKKIADAHKEVDKLKPQIKQQEDLEKQKESLQTQIATAKSAENQIKSLDAKIERLREQYKENQHKKKEAEEKSLDAKNLEELQNRDDELRKNLANLRAKFESDKKFQSEIQNGLCPILSEKCLNLEEGKTLEDFVSSQFTEVKSKISAFEKEQQTLQVSLKTSREAEKFLAKLEPLKKRETEIATEGKQLKEEKETIQKQTENLEKAQEKLSEIESQLKSLDNPKAKLKIFEAEIGRETEIREKLTNIESNFERLESDRRLKVEQLETYKDLDSNWKEFSAKRDETSEAHKVYLANETLAKSLPEKKKELVEVQEKTKNLADEIKKFEKDFDAINKDYDSEKHEKEKFELLELEKRLTETKANLEYTQKRENELTEELKRLEKIKISMEDDFNKKERFEKIGEATAFIRSTLKEAAPRVAQNYVFHVSNEANQMFREITGDAERTLKWTDDYGILLEENGHERPFRNLSGGEQMVAALSVRLTLLKQLSDVNLAFFDEPTTNMDAQRRELLAEQISEITEKQTFDQLFVISHDDTFESYVDNVITVRANGKEE